MLHQRLVSSPHTIMRFFGILRADNEHATHWHALDTQQPAHDLLVHVHTLAFCNARPSSYSMQMQFCRLDACVSVPREGDARDQVACCVSNTRSLDVVQADCPRLPSLAPRGNIDERDLACRESKRKEVCRVWCRQRALQYTYHCVRRSVERQRRGDEDAYSRRCEKVCSVACSALPFECA